MNLLLLLWGAVIGLGAGRPPHPVGSRLALSRGYWLNTHYRLGVDPNADSSFVPVHYLYSTGKSYTVATHRDEEHPVRVERQANGTERLTGVLFNANYVRNAYPGATFRIEQDGPRRYLLTTYRGRTWKDPLRRSDRR